VSPTPGQQHNTDLKLVTAACTTYGSITPGAVTTLGDVGRFEIYGVGFKDFWQGSSLTTPKNSTGQMPVDQSGFASAGRMVTG